MEPTNNIERLEAKIDAVYEAIEKMRKYAQIMMWVTIAFVVLPVIGLLFAIPAFINSYTTNLNGLL